MTALLLTCSYKDDQEFLRVGYYVNVEYDSPEMNENPPATPVVERLTRHILAEKPRVTKFQIDWDEEEQAAVGVAPQLGMDPTAAAQESLMAKGTQGLDRNDMMSSANLAQAAQNFQQQ